MAAATAHLGETMMNKSRVLLVFLIFIGILSGCDWRTADVPAVEPPTTHKVDWYIKTATELQALGREKALDRLRIIAKEADEGLKVFVLCRMLFSGRVDTEFRRPLLGAAVFMAETTYADWPLEPIELVDGVPFHITGGYILAGRAERPSSYVEYCVKDCDWSSYQFSPKTKAEKRRALDKLLSSAKWKRSLGEHGRAFLSAQIQ
jgi:hypothetical protein